MKHILAITLCLLALPVIAQDAPSGFLSDYTRLEKEGSMFSRYMGYAAPGAKTINKTPVVYISPLVRFPHDAKFGDLDDALVGALDAARVAHARDAARLSKALGDSSRHVER